MPVHAMPVYMCYVAMSLPIDSAMPVYMCYVVMSHPIDSAMPVYMCYLGCLSQ